MCVCFFSFYLILLSLPPPPLSSQSSSFSSSSLNFEATIFRCVSVCVFSRFTWFVIYYLFVWYLIFCFVLFCLVFADTWQWMMYRRVWCVCSSLPLYVFFGDRFYRWSTFLWFVCPVIDIVQCQLLHYIRLLRAIIWNTMRYAHSQSHSPRIESIAVLHWILNSFHMCNVLCMFRLCHRNVYKTATIAQNTLVVRYQSWISFHLDLNRMNLICFFCRYGKMWREKGQNYSEIWGLNRQVFF